MEDTEAQQVWRDLYGDEQRAVELRRDAQRWRALCACDFKIQSEGTAYLNLEFWQQGYISTDRDGAEVLTDFADRLLAGQDAPGMGANLSDDGESL